MILPSDVVSIDLNTIGADKKTSRYRDLVIQIVGDLTLAGVGHAKVNIKVDSINSFRQAFRRYLDKQTGHARLRQYTIRHSRDNSAIESTYKGGGMVNVIRLEDKIYHDGKI